MKDLHDLLNIIDEVESELVNKQKYEFNLLGIDYKIKNEGTV